MPFHAGTFWFDRRPTSSIHDWDPSTRNPSLATGHREAGLAMTEDGHDVWAIGSGSMRVALRQPALAMTWDGRLDNRDDLLLQLGSCASTSADAEIALAIVERFGISGLKTLIGDWSAAIWDRTTRTLHLARDYMGARPLYYVRARHAVAWSSHHAELVDRAGQRDMLCDAFAAHFMSLRPSPELTPYAGIHAVPGGTCLSIDERGREQRTRFWQLAPGRIRYADPRCYEEHLRALWRDALRARLRTDGTVWAELSGGLDSSSVVCMADRLIKERGLPARAIRLVSHATLRSPEGDERRFIAEIEQQVGVVSEIVGVEDNQSHVDPELVWVTPYALQGVGLETVRRVRAGGGRVVLSGRLGDAVMGCQPDNSDAVFDDVAGGHVLAALANLRRWSRATRKPFVEIAWRLFVPARDAAQFGGAALLTPCLRAMVSSGNDDHLRGVCWSKRALARLVLGYTGGGRLDVPYLPPDIVYTYPFAHRPLVDFMLAIPGEELSAPGVTRSLMRRAFMNLVPARVLQRVSKGYYPPAAFRAARQLAASLVSIDELEIVQRGWIDPDRLKHALRTLTDGSAETGGDIHCILRLERWLQARHTHSAIQQRKEVNTNEVLHT
jgi:asparagine synthase (glutamine-hydrolysing)